MAVTLRHSISAMSSSDSLTLKTTPRIKQCVASYHTTKVIAHKTSYSKLRPKIDCHGNVPQHLWTPMWHMIPMAHRSSQPKQHVDRFSRFADDSRVSLDFTMRRPFPPQNCPFPWGNWTLHLIHGSWPHPGPQPKRHLDRCSRFCRAH